MEEYKQFALRKFADKIETSKSLRFVEVKIKTINEKFIKKMDRGDNWLIAKKPLDYTCASCEGYIGNLTETTQHINWEKYPVREEKYRLGEGFSKILQSLDRKKDERIMIKDKLPTVERRIIEVTKKELDEKVEPVEIEENGNEPKMFVFNQR